MGMFDDFMDGKPLKQKELPRINVSAKELKKMSDSEFMSYLASHPYESKTDSEANDFAQYRLARMKIDKFGKSRNKKDLKASYKSYFN